MLFIELVLVLSGLGSTHCNQILHGIYHFLSADTYICTAVSKMMYLYFKYDFCTLMYY